MGYTKGIVPERHAVDDKIANTPLVVFHTDGAVSASDGDCIGSRRRIVSAGVFGRRFDGRLLTFRYNGSQFHNEHTESTWDSTVVSLLANEEREKHWKTIAWPAIILSGPVALQV